MIKIVTSITAINVSDNSDQNINVNGDSVAICDNGIYVSFDLVLNQS